MIMKPLIALALSVLVSLMPTISTASVDREWNFKVYLDDKEIGYHRFSLKNQGENKLLSSEAEFDVTFLKIPFYSYAHSNNEIWSGQCLNKIAATTDDNGKPYQISGVISENNFILDTLSDRRVLPRCVSTFAYWDQSFLTRNQLLNSQTGEFLDVTSQLIGNETINAGSQQIAAMRYRLIAEDTQIDLWYSKDKQWLALESITDSGRVLRYIIE